MKLPKHIIKNWRKKRQAAKERREMIEALFEDFVEDTRSLVRRAPKYQEAALYRHVWKRSIVYQTICQDVEDVLLYVEFQKLAAKRYDRIAPENIFGKVLLEFSDNAHDKMLKQEMKRFYPEDENENRQNENLGCIYVGFDSKNKIPYIGKTTGHPEFRWKEHRVNGTGPFKNGASYANWEVIEENVLPEDLDELKAYYIGLYNAYEDGHNDTRGNNWQAYEKGLKGRQKIQ